MTLDIALVGGLVRTVDSNDTTAEAVLVRNGKISAVGTREQILAAGGHGVKIVDVAGNTIIPGMIDAHNHASTAAVAPDAVNCASPPYETLESMLAAVFQHGQSLPAGKWMIGLGFSSGHVSEGRGPTRLELDEASPENPFFLLDRSCHMGWANSRAMELVGVNSHAPQPWGGEFEKDASGELTGVLFETAINPFLSASWATHMTEDWDHGIELIERKLRDYLAVGLTAISDALVTPEAAKLYRRADAAGRLPITVQQLHGADGFFAQQDLRRSDIVARIKGSETMMLRGNAVKVFTDRGFPDGPTIDERHHNCTKHVGTAFYTNAEIKDLALRAADLGIAPTIHAMGNCAVDAVLDAYESVRRGAGDDVPLRLEHAFIAEPRQGERAASLGVDLVLNPGLGVGDAETIELWRRRGQDHLKVLPVRSMIEGGARVSLASDHPCGAYSPFEVMWGAVARRSDLGNLFDPDEAITPAQALRGYTANAANAVGRGAEEGSIEVGKRANFAILDRDIVTCPTDDIRGTQVSATYVDGTLAYEAPVGNQN